MNKNKDATKFDLLPSQALANLDAALSNLRTVRAIISDIDGTLVHYPATIKKQGYILLKSEEKEIKNEKYKMNGKKIVKMRHEPTGRTCQCLEVPNVNLGVGYISTRTIELIVELRKRYGVKFVLVTGGPDFILMERRKANALPDSEYDIFENGGRIWHYHHKCSKDCAANKKNVFLQDISYKIIEDEEWRERFEPLCGPKGQYVLNLKQRKGLLWDICRQLRSEGYYVSFRFCTACVVCLRLSKCCLPIEKGGQGIPVEVALEALRFRFKDNKEFNCVTNLNFLLLFPKQSGKKNAVDYLLKKLNINEPSKECVALFDDENDLEFAEMCGCGFIPSIAHASVVNKIAEINAKVEESTNERSLNTNLKICSNHNKSPRWVCTPIEGPLGTDMALEAIVRKMQQVEIFSSENFFPHL